MTWAASVLIGAAALVLGAGACSSEGDTPDAEPGSVAPTDSATTADPDADRCADGLKAVEEAVEIGEFGAGAATEVGGLPACQAEVSASPVGAEKVQVIDVSAADWARSVGPLLEQLKGTLGGENDQKLEQGLKLLDDELPASRACELFTTMVVTIQGAPAGSDTIVNYVPNQHDPLAANAQNCGDGRYLSVQVEGDVEVAPTLEDQLIAALGALRAADRR